MKGTKNAPYPQIRKALIMISRNAMDHLEAGHNVVAFWKTETVGFIRLIGPDTDVYQTKSLEDGPTEEATCRTCSQDLDIDTLDI